MSSLTTDQKIDAIYQKFVVGAPGPGTPFTGSDPTGAPTFIPDQPSTPTSVPPPAIGWWRPIDAFRVFPPLAVGDYAGAQDYAGNGHFPNGAVALSGDRLELARKQSDALSRCNTADDANRLVAGAGRPGVEMDAVIYAVMVGRVDTSGTQNPQYGYGFRTIAEWVGYLQSQATVTPGQGPGIG
jgi:hypothetical protein